MSPRIDAWDLPPLFGAPETDVHTQVHMHTQGRALLGNLVGLGQWGGCSMPLMPEVGVPGGGDPRVHCDSVIARRLLPASSSPCGSGERPG